MKLTNVVVQFTVTIPEIEVDKELGIELARGKIITRAEIFVSDQVSQQVDVIIKDCPSYPALCH